MQKSLQFWCVPALALGLGCSGDIGMDEADPSNPADSPGFAGDTPVGAAGAPGVPGGDPGAMGPLPADVDPECLPDLPARLVLLSDLQHENSVTAALGDVARDPGSQINAATKPFSQKGFVVSTSLVHGRLGQAEFAAATVPDRLLEVTGCPGGEGDAADDACARGFLERFTAEAFRRPVDSAEIDDLMVVYALGKETDFVTGVRLAVEAVLSAPSFTYRSELGQPAGGGLVRLDDHELASQLSFMLTDAPPDAELTQAAQAGTLSDPAELERQVTRMLELPQVQESLTKTLMAAWQVANLFGTVKDPGLFPEYGPALQSSMVQETEAFVHDVLWVRDEGIAGLLSSRESYADEALMSIYDLPPTGSGDMLTPVTLPPERSGLLTQASILATLSRTDNTSVVARGLFVRGALLCLPKVPGPPEALQTDIQELLAADMTERERAEVRAGDATCGACHSQFDAFGLLLEGFDPLGRYRETLDGEPIDTSVELQGLGSFDGVYQDAASFAQALSTSTEFNACITRHLMAYATADDTLAAGGCMVENALATVASPAPDMRELVKAAAQSPALVLRREETP